jgi:hypothetical protein
MTTEELRRQSLEQYASLRRKAMFEAQQNTPITVTPNAAAGASGGGSKKDCSINEYVVNDYICDYFE